MLRKKWGTVEWLEFEIFQECPISHGVFLRKGGISEYPFSSLNVGDDLGDTEEAVNENKERVRKILGANKLVFANQVHGKEIEIVHVGREHACVDGLITKTLHLGLTIRHADCQAAIFYDPVENVLANVHSGWRGNVENIYKRVVDCFKTQFYSKVENLLVGISPSLGPRKAEFIHYAAELPQSFQAFQESPNYFNFWEISKQQLIQEGLLPNHIEIAGICTFENSEDFFSFRRSKTTGRNATAAMLHPKGACPEPLPLMGENNV